MDVKAFGLNEELVHNGLRLIVDAEFPGKGIH